MKTDTERFGAERTAGFHEHLTDGVHWRTPLPEDVIPYLEDLLAEYGSKRGNYAYHERPTWADLCAVELALAYAKSEEELRRVAWSWRSRFSGLTTEAEYKQYLASIPPDPTKAEVKELRADVEYLIKRSYYLYSMMPPVERLRFRLTTLNSLEVVAVIALVIVWFYHPHSASAFLWSMLAGAAGGIMSFQQRLQSLRVADPILLRLQLGGSFQLASLAMSPLSGIVFAALLYMFFAGGLLQGSPFPQFYTPEPAAGGAPSHAMKFEDFFATGPVGGASLAKLLVWSFIAGFAERFVPDALTRLTNDANAKGGTGPR